MKTARYRQWIHRYGNLGVLMVGAVLLAHHLWTRRRPVLFGWLVVLSAFGFWLSSHPYHQVRTRITPVVAGIPAQPPKSVIVHRPLLERATRICSTKGWE